MKPYVLFSIIFMSVLSGGCRQPDGPMPTLNEDTSNAVSDLGRDIQAVARGETSARKEFVDDFWGLADEETAQQQPVLDFAGRFADALAKASLTEASAQQLARTCLTLVGATELSERQVRALQEEFRSELTTAGMAPERVDAIVAEVPTVQRAVTTRPRRWYEVL